MNKREVGMLLAIASGFDNRKTSELQTAAWFEVLHGADFEQCKRIVIDHYSGPKHSEYLTVGIITDGLRVVNRQSKENIATDIRAAKARGILSADWPRDLPLTPEYAEKLAQARSRDRETATVYELEMGDT